MTETAVVVRDDTHPIIAAIDERMPQIAEILPEGMRADRFRKVVVQAMLRNRDLWDCTPISLITAITEAAEVGIEPTGVLGKGWLIPYKREAKFIPGWRGFVDLLWRADRILLTVDVVRAGDEFSYRRGTDAFLHHVPDLADPDREKSAANVTYAYVLARFPDGREDFEVMSRVALDRIRDKAKSKNPVWESDWVEMAKKTPVRRIAKRLPLSPAVQAMLGRDEEIDYDTPIERVPDPKRDGLRDRIAERTAAIRGGDPWMRRLHAVGDERGMDHAALHDWAADHFHVASLRDLSTPQRATFMELVERMEVMPTSAPSVADQDAPAASDGEAVDSAAASPIDSPAAGEAHPPGRSQPSAAPTDAEILAAAGEGAELLPPKPGTPAYKALPNGTARAQAKAWHDAHKSEPQQESLAEALGAPEPDR